MVNRPRKRMPISERAKIFAPFAALKGLNEALKEKEKIRISKKELSEDMAEELNTTLKTLSIGDIATVVYYNNTEMQYFQLTGNISKIDTFNRIIQINFKKIPFDDLLKIFI